MNRIQHIAEEITILSLVINLASFATAAVGGLFDIPALIMFWYLGLIGLWVMLATAAVAGIAMLLNSSNQWLKRQSDHSKRQRQHSPHAVT